MAVMFWLDLRLALWSLLPVVPMLVVYLLLKKQLREASQAQRSAASETSAALESYFSGVSVIQAHVAESRIGDAMGEQLSERAVHELRLAKLWVAFSIFFQATNVVGQLVIVFVGGLRVLDGSLGLGTFFAFYHYLGLLLGAHDGPPEPPRHFATGLRVHGAASTRSTTTTAPGEGGACRGERGVEQVERLDAAEVAFAYPFPPPPPQRLDEAAHAGPATAPEASEGQEEPFSLGPWASTFARASA